jgi:hypothetical protein
MTLEQAGLKVVDLQTALKTPNETLIVALGAPSMSKLSGYLGRFARNGGAVLLGADSGAATPIGGTYNAQVTTSDLRYAVQNNVDCIQLTIDNSNNDALLSGVHTVVINSGSYIYQTSASFRPWTNHLTWGQEAANRFRGKALLSSSPGPTSTNARQNTQSTNPETESQDIQIIFCADPSLFTNGMVWHGDNAILVINVANALSKGRKQLYFMADGQSLPSYQGLLQEAGALAAAEQSPELEIEQMLRLANTVVANAEDSDLLNEMLANRPRRIPTPYYHRGLLFFLAFVIVCIALYLLFSQLPRRAPHAHVPANKAPPGTLGLKSFDSSPEHRRGEAAQALAAAALTAVTGSDDPEKWLEIGTDQDQRKRRLSAGQLSQLQQLIDLATSTAPRPLALSELSNIDRLATQVRAGL